MNTTVIDRDDQNEYDPTYGTVQRQLFSFGKKCEVFRYELQWLKACETKGKYLEVLAPLAESP